MNGTNAQKLGGCRPCGKGGLNLTTLQWLHPLSIQVMVSITAGRPLGPGTLEKGWVRPKQAWVGI